MSTLRVLSAPQVNDACVVGASGELSDFQFIMRWVFDLSC